MWKAFLFGAIVAAAIGPIALLIFEIGSRQGFAAGAYAGLGAALADCLFALAAFLAGALILLGLYGILLWRAFRVALLSRDPFGTYLAAGIASMFALQMFVNVGMNVGIMPITGIPLPFVSYGGSSLLLNLASVGLLLNVHMRRFA